MFYYHIKFQAVGRSTIRQTSMMYCRLQKLKIELHRQFESTDSKLALWFAVSLSVLFSQEYNLITVLQKESERAEIELIRNSASRYWCNSKLLGLLNILLCYLMSIYSKLNLAEILLSWRTVDIFQQLILCTIIYCSIFILR